MRGLAWGPSLALALTLGLGGCAPDPASNVTGICTVVCRCEAGGLPSQQRECVNECVGDLAAFEIPNACVECIYANADSCATLMSTCENACEIDEPVPDDGSPPDARTNVDAN